MRAQVLKGALRPQVSWLKDFRGDIPLNYMARFESLAKDFSSICAQLGLGKVNLSHERKGNSQDFRNHIEPETRELIAEAYREEIELFGYSFDD
jgi:hypothetical protein